MVSRSLLCLTYLLLLLPPLLLTTYFFAAFPSPPDAIHLQPSLSSLPPSSKSWVIYPEEFFPGGNYVSFPYGRVRYWTMGPVNGKKIVLIHGLSVPSIMWKRVAPELTARGYRVLLYDLYGRGYSDAPQTVYNAALYTTQLALLMQHVKWDRAAIMGVSMGAGVAASFTANFPELVDEVVLISSTGVVDAADMSRTSKIMSSPMVQALASSRPARKFLQYMTDAASENLTLPMDVESSQDLQAIVRIQSAHLPGYDYALSSSLRDGPIRGLASAFQSEAFSKRKVLIIHGTNDTTVPYKCAGVILQLLPKDAITQLVTIEGGRHDLAVEQHDVILDAFEQFMKP